MPSRVALAKKSLMESFELSCKQTTEGLKSYLEMKRKEFMKEMNEAIDLAAQLPGIDLSIYDVVRRVYVAWPYSEARSLTMKIGDYSQLTVVVRPGEEYEGIFLWRRRVPETKKEVQTK